jgi:hypothetical protein
MRLAGAGAPAAAAEWLWVDILGTREAWVLALAGVGAFLPVIEPRISGRIRQRAGRADWNLPLPARVFGALVLLVLSAASLANLNYNPFIYFRF